MQTIVSSLYSSYEDYTLCPHLYTVSHSAHTVHHMQIIIQYSPFNSFCLMFLYTNKCIQSVPAVSHPSASFNLLLLYTHLCMHLVTSAPLLSASFYLLIIWSQTLLCHSPLLFFYNLLRIYRIPVGMRLVYLIPTALPPCPASILPSINRILHAQPGLSAEEILA